MRLECFLLLAFAFALCEASSPSGLATTHRRKGTPKASHGQHDHEKEKKKKHGHGNHHDEREKREIKHDADFLSLQHKTFPILQAVKSEIASVGSLVNSLEENLRQGDAEQVDNTSPRVAAIHEAVQPDASAQYQFKQFTNGSEGSTEEPEGPPPEGEGEPEQAAYDKAVSLLQAARRADEAFQRERKALES